MWNDTYWQLEAANTPWAAAFSDMEQKKNLVHVFTVELIAFTIYLSIYLIISFLYVVAAPH